MASYNKCMFIGNLGADPDIRFTESGTSVTNFNMAVNRKWSNSDGESQEQTEWIRVVTWGKLAETVGQYLVKGSPVFVEGRLQTRKWQDDNGVDRYATEVVASTVQFLGKASSSGDYRDNEPPPMGDADIPFE